MERYHLPYAKVYWYHNVPYVLQFQKRKMNGLNLEDLVSRALYRRGPIGVAGISCVETFED